jgi:hypothetical protein
MCTLKPNGTGMNRKINRKDESDGNGRGDRQMRRAKKKGYYQMGHTRHK